MIKVDKNVPIPNNAGGGRRKKYPWNEMEVGDSFEIEAGKEKAVRSAASYFASRFHDRTGKQIKFAVCRDDNGTFRCWRIE
jgi:hypothetical protein